MQYLHDYNLMKRLSKTSKRHLAWDAERLAGAMALWVAHSQDRQYVAYFLKLQRLPNATYWFLCSNTVLEQAARTVLSLEANGEDVIRQYFRHHVSSDGKNPQAVTQAEFSQQLNRLEVLLEAYLPVLQSQAVEASLPLNERTHTLFQVDRDLALVYRAVNRHRVEQGNLYGIPLGPDSQTCLSEPWTSRPTLLKLLRLAFEATEALLTERSREIGSNIDDSGADEYGSTLHLQSGRVVANIEEERQTQHLLKAYLVDLADHTLAMHQERMSYLQR